MIADLTIPELLAMRAKIDDEIKARGVVHTANVLGDVTEFAFRFAMGWQPAPNNAKSYDAIDAEGRRIQIKGRRLNVAAGSFSAGLSAIRSHDFALLAVVLFKPDFTIRAASILPLDVVMSVTTRSNHTNSSVLTVTPRVLAMPGVVDVTAALTAAMANLPMRAPSA